MKRAWPVAAIAAAAIVLPVASSSSDSPGAPSAALSVTPNPVVAGEQVTLDASGSSDGGAIVSYAWDLDGDGSFERVGGGASSLRWALAEPGSVRVGVRVVDDEGLSADAFETVTVEPRPKAIAAAPEPVAEPAAAEPRAAAAEPEAAAEPKAAKELSAEPGPAEPRADASTRGREARVRKAASATVTIRDFSFAPKSVTVNTGDTVTWRNSGDEVHTATGSGFDTGNLSSGQSGSHTFNSAGTFSYVCKPHPFMRASVRVVGSGGGGGGSGDDGVGSTSSGDDGSTAGAAGSGSGDDLPSTGLMLLALALPGFLMLLTGLVLRRGIDSVSR